jgi:hypothetical protein
MEPSGRFGVLDNGKGAGGRSARPISATCRFDSHPIKGTDMTISTLALTPLISLIAGVLILVMPRLLNYIVALYLIVVGLLGLFPHLAS